MDPNIRAWTFLETVLPKEVPSKGIRLNGAKFKDRKGRRSIMPMRDFVEMGGLPELSGSPGETISCRYYLDCYEQHQLVTLLRNHFGSGEELVDKPDTRLIGLSFLTDDEGKYVEGSLFVPHLQMVIHDLKTTGQINYDQFTERYDKARKSVQESARILFSDGVGPESVVLLQKAFRSCFHPFLDTGDGDYVGIEIRSRNRPANTPLFHSFYLNDLQRILKEGPNETLRQFTEGRPLRTDIDENRQAIEQCLRPENLPLGRWPSPVAYRLSLMQQVAVNEILNGTERISSVNGPPGTGKTTLLKDVFAQVVVERATRMTEFKDPSEAFGVVGKLKVNQEELTMYGLDERLSGQSMVVASSNNGAVENISKELPRLDAIARNSEAPTEEECLEAMRLSGADLRYQHECEVAYQEEVTALGFYPALAAEVIQEDPAWGLFSAAMGKTANINGVISALSGGAESERLSLIEQLRLDAEDVSWETEVREFNELKRSIEQKRSALQKYVDEEKTADSLRSSLHKTGARLNRAQEDLNGVRREEEQADRQKSLIREQLDSLPAPGFVEKLKKLFGGETNENERKLHEELQTVLETQKRLHKKSHELEDSLKTAEAHRQQLEDRLAAIRQSGERYGAQRLTLSDDALWGREAYEERQQSVIWQTDELNFQRGLLFLKAMKVHKAFLAKNHRQVGTALAVLSGRRSLNLNIDSSRKYLADMWNVLHLIFPVISTTFASFGAMYKGIGRDAIGCLFIDEAGQASPQQAAGALWRSRRAVVVGDPLQIEPVVTLDDTILHDVRQAFGVTEASVGSAASVQTLADHANPIGTYTGGGEDRQRIGIPLWVHRRCIEPMFSIANQIAYGNKMVLAVKKTGKSGWFDAAGRTSQAQYVPEQGQLVLQELRKHFEKLPESGSWPDVFVITPFTAVKDELKQLVNKELGKEASHWADRSIGTVHTFQGKEADIVYFVTGTDSDTDGAANWSCAKPNLLNVAVTRAKKEFYVIGDARRFGSKPHYQVIQQKLEVVRATDRVR